MKRAFAVSLMVAVVATSLLGPAEAAKKKKPKPPAPPAPVQVDATYFLRRDGDTCEDASLFLSLVDAEDVDPGSCGNWTFGVLAPHLETLPMNYATRGVDGVPVTLDATKEITGLIGVKSTTSVPVANQSLPIRWGVGKTTLNVELIGVTADGEKTIGTAAVDYDVTPGDANQKFEVEFTMKPDAALDKMVFTALTLRLHNSGNSVGHGFYTTDNPASFFKMGTWK
jgi:hypothetical protein